MLRAAPLFAILALPFPAAAQERTWCMDGWSGEICFDVLTFQLSEATYTLGGSWRGAGYPIDNVDHHGRGPFAVLGVFDYLSTLTFLDAAAETSQWTRGRTVTDGYGQTIGFVSSLGDVSYLALGARRTSVPDPLATAEERAWDEATCRTEQYARPGDAICRVVSVPEPSSLLLLASGMLGLGYTARRRRRAGSAA